MKVLKELYRRALISLFIQSPSLQLLAPGVPRTPWNRHKTLEELAAWYGRKTTGQSFNDGLLAAMKKHGLNVNVHTASPREDVTR